MTINSINKANILVLYQELSQYFLDCLSVLVQQSSMHAVIISHELNDEAPFNLVVEGDIVILQRKNFDDQKLALLTDQLKPKLIFVAGWSDKAYLKIARANVDTTVTLLGFDNQWRFTIRKLLGVIYARFYIIPYFDYCFVPGSLQRKYANKLGFVDSQIIEGAYSADTHKFDGYFRQCMAVKAGAFPKRFLYLGRYVRHKGIFELWEAFIRFRKSHPDWELWCVGTGDQYSHRVESEGIRHLGFVQPDALLPILKDTGVYILPSHFEPWGVSVHEMAVAGFPLLLSDAIGAREDFLDDGVNGMVFESGSADSIFKAMEAVAQHGQDELMKMGEHSHTLGMKNTPEIWAQRLQSLMNRNAGD